jgi:hypothetical protein
MSILCETLLGAHIKHARLDAISFPKLLNSLKYILHIPGAYALEISFEFSTLIHIVNGKYLSLTI